MNEQVKTAIIVLAIIAAFVGGIGYQLVAYSDCVTANKTPVRGAFTFVCVETAK